ncbi:hypothetical protein [Seonamhaeicola marinus]|uniref:Uncharacterized protein n=1 Tax=Seonamhaeicola marinus TaxID=1912246 RepID=A0A5D0HLC3_9FLAO|nr:hypothetical protein [Seonamhaeicola marinus]TYA71780.1 hypothetical protein FUA24_19710 [Seonamhaeicola marinus]
MKHFLLEYTTTVIRLVEIIAAITGVFCYKKYKETAGKYFIFFLVYIAILEIIGSYVVYVRPDRFLYFLQGTLIEKNYWLYTICWKIIAILFFSFYFYKVLKSYKLKSIVRYTASSYLIFSVVYVIFNWKAFFHMFFPVLSILGALIVFMCSTFYFVELMQSERILFFYKYLSFYIAAVIFIWWLIITPLTFYDLFYDKFDLTKPFRHPEFFGDINYVFLRRKIYLFSNIFMYLTYTFALLWCRPQND